VIKQIEAAGAIVWRRRAKNIEVLLVHRPKYNDWSFPKGKLDKNEKAESAAVREVEEETGLPIVLDQAFGQIEYDTEGVKDLAVATRKSVKYYIGHIVDASLRELKPRKKVKPASKKEIDQVQWFEMAEAKGILTYRDDKNLLDKFDLELKHNPEIGQRIQITLQRVRKKSYTTKQLDRKLNNCTLFLSSFGVNTLIALSNKKSCLRVFEEYSKQTGIEVSIFDQDKQDSQLHELISTARRIAIVK
jgi:8-oxo-dGTP pyrophosphatase MutT (NUDIX family)